MNPRNEVRVPWGAADRGPQLIIAAERDHAVPAAESRAAYRIQECNASATELVALPEAGHSLAVGSSWEPVARKALAFVEAQTRTATDSPLRAIASEQSGQVTAGVRCIWASYP